LKTVVGKESSCRATLRELTELRTRLSEAEETLCAIRRGKVDAVMVSGIGGPQVFTLEGAERAYRVLIESMNEGALALTADKVILYANQRFARMVKRPLERVMGNSFCCFLSPEDRKATLKLVKRNNRAASKIQVFLNADDGSRMPVQVSIRPLARKGTRRATMGVVVTDMTEALRTEKMLRALAHRVVQVQEAERGRVALELHDNITQPLCAILVRLQVLANKASSCHRPAEGESARIQAMLGQTVHEVERISRNLRPSVLDQMGLVAVLRDTCNQFGERTGVSLKMDCDGFEWRLPVHTELTLYRILQETLKNVEKHARAARVTVSLRRRTGFVQLVVKDDGVGFDPNHPPGTRTGKGCLGLLGMRERAAYVDGTFEIKSVRHAGTQVEVCIPLPRGGKTD